MDQSARKSASTGSGILANEALYLETDIPAGMTCAAYRHQLRTAATTGRHRLRRRRQARDKQA